MMTKRFRFFLIGGSLGLGVVYIALSIYVKHATSDFSRLRSDHAKWDSSGKGPKVVLGSDGDWSRVGPVIHIDVRDGIAWSRIDGHTVENVVSYVSAEMRRTDAHIIVVSAGHREKFGDIAAVVDACRRTSASTVVLNQHTSDFTR